MPNAKPETKTPRVLRMLSLSAALLLAPGVQAQTIVQEMLRCAALQSDVVRLACYDAVMGAGGNGAGGMGGTAVMEPSSDQWQAASGLIGGDYMKLDSRIVGEVDGLSEGREFRLRNGEVWRQSEEIDIPYRAINPWVEIREGLLGSYQMRLEGLEERISVRLAQVDTRIMGEVNGLREGTQFTLRNGQVWEQRDDTAIDFRVTNPRIRIGRGFLGSYQMRVEGLDERISVRRVK